MEASSKNYRYRFGESVEVYSKQEGFVGSYYVAKVLDFSKNNDDVLVEYKTLLTDDESRWLREWVSVSEVRPRPPQLHVSNFNLNDEVDAYDNEGWWVGRITSISEFKYYACFSDATGRSEERLDIDEIPDQKRRMVDESKYYVYFSYSGDLTPYTFSQLRLHQEWKNCRWVPSGSCLQ